MGFHAKLHNSKDSFLVSSTKNCLAHERLYIPPRYACVYTRIPPIYSIQSFILAMLGF